MKTILPTTWKVPESFKSRVGETVGRQRAMIDEGHLLLILHAPPEPGEDERIARLFWREPDGSWKSNALGAGIAALKAHLADFDARLEKIDEDLQAAATARDYYRLLQTIAPLHRTARNLHATLQQARELLPGERELINARDTAVELERTAELLHGDAKNGLDFRVANETEEQSRRGYEMSVAAHRLNLLVAVFFPIATLSTIFGMNLVHGMEHWNAPWAFWGVLGIGLVSGMFLTTLVASKPAAHTPKPIRQPTLAQAKRR